MNESELLRRLKSRYQYVRTAAGNPNATERVLLTAVKDKDWLVRRAAAGNPNATERILLEAMRDKDPDVRLAAVNHPNATERVFKLAALDTDERVCKAVAYSEKASTVAKIVGAMGM
jgi:HEAT repeat protein